MLIRDDKKLYEAFHTITDKKEELAVRESATVLLHEYYIHQGHIKRAWSTASDIVAAIEAQRKLH